MCTADGGNEQNCHTPQVSSPDPLSVLVDLGRAFPKEDPASLCFRAYP